MIDKIHLEQEYLGDEDWSDMVKWAKEDFWEESEYQTKLLNAVKNEKEIAMVIYAKLDKNSIEWVYQKIPALDNLTPLECLQTPLLKKRLKVCLMRFPC